MTVSQSTTQAPFFFSSRRRHTSSHGDWSSDVCSSDLDRALEGRGVHEHREALRRPQVREEVELLPEGEEPTLGALLVSDVVPLGAADRAEEDRVGLPAQLERARRQWAAGLVDRGAANERRLELEADPGALADRLEDADGLGRHL